MRHVIVIGTSINEVWFRAIRGCLAFGRDYKIDKGEYEGQYRRELDFVTLHIKRPHQRPLACSLPGIKPTSEEGIEKYFWNYILNDDFDSEEERKNNEYKYASWIALSLEYCCELLAKGQGGCNQATISLGNGANQEWHYTHPPCLRLIDMRLTDYHLKFILYFRSWDLIAGLPENLGGLQLLKEMCVDLIELQSRSNIFDGPIIAMSKGLHIYDHFWEIAEKEVGEYEYLRDDSKDDLEDEGFTIIEY